jgi:thioredoxin reductase
MAVDVAVVGAGPAGCAAAIQCRRLGLSVALMDRCGVAGGLIKNAWSIENEPATGGAISGPEYVRRLESALDRFGVAVMRGSVQSIGANYKLEGDFEEVEAGAVILATGTVPLAAGIDGEPELAGEYLYYEVAPALAKNPSSALVVGGGEAAFDYALSLASGGATVAIAVRDRRHRANARLAEAVTAEPLITVHLATTVAGLKASAGGCRATLVSALVTNALRVNIVVVGIGRSPTLPDFDDATIRARAGRVGAKVDATSVDKRFSIFDKLTIAPGLYIAGDVRLGSLGQSGIAVGDGLEAAQLAASFLANSREIQ